MEECVVARQKARDALDKRPDVSLSSGKRRMQIAGASFSQLRCYTLHLLRSMA
jgi:hypothetical protein